MIGAISLKSLIIVGFSPCRMCKWIFTLFGWKTCLKKVADSEFAG